MNHTMIWAMYFASIVAIKEHPRNEKGADLDSCAKLADKMMFYTEMRHQKFIKLKEHFPYATR